MATRSVTATITTQNTGTDWLEFDGDVRQFNVSVSGTFSAVVTVQRRFGASGTIHDVKIYTTAAEEIGTAINANTQYRLFVKTGEFTSGSAALELNY